MRLAWTLIPAIALAGCTTAEKPKTASSNAPAKPFDWNPDPFPSTYKPYPSRPTVVRNATIYDGEGGRIEHGSVVMADGKIVAIGGADLAAPAGAEEVDGTGKWVTPGVIDIHSHLGDYPSPGVDALSDGNEATSPVRPEVWAEHSVWP